MLILPDDDVGLAPAIAGYTVLIFHFSGEKVGVVGSLPFESIPP